MENESEEPENEESYLIVAGNPFDGVVVLVDSSGELFHSVEDAMEAAEKIKESSEIVSIARPKGFVSDSLPIIDNGYIIAVGTVADGFTFHGDENGNLFQDAIQAVEYAEENLSRNNDWIVVDVGRVDQARQVEDDDDDDDE